MIPDYEYDLSDELTRKSGEALSWLENEYQRGAMSANAYFMALQAVDMATLGLIPDEYSMWVSDRRSQIGRADADDKALFVLHDSDMTGVVRLDRGKDCVELVIYKAGKKHSSKIFDFSQETDSVKSAYDKFLAVKKFLTDKGYNEV